jgi:hypothetical protein
MLRSIRTLGAALAVATMLAANPVLAGADDYRFELVGKPVRTGDVALVRLRLVHLPDGKPVAGAILLPPRLEMGTGPGAMTAPAKVAAPPEPGLYAVEARPGMGGEWQLSLGAKVPGEAATVQGRIVLDLAQ